MGEKSSRSRREEEESATDAGAVARSDETEQVPDIQPSLDLGWLGSSQTLVETVPLGQSRLSGPFETDHRLAQQGSPDIRRDSGPGSPARESTVELDDANSFDSSMTFSRAPVRSALSNGTETASGNSDGMRRTSGPATDRDYESTYGVEITRPAQAETLDHLAAIHGDSTIHAWAEEGMPIEAMASPQTRRLFRERKETPVPWDAEINNERFRRRSNAAAREDEPAGSVGLPAVIRRALAEPGTTPDESMREYLAERLGENASDVRIHAGATAAAATDHLDARAFVVGNHVVFNRGEYDPGDDASRALLAHEIEYARTKTPGTLSMLPQVDERGQPVDGAGAGEAEPTTARGPTEAGSQRSQRQSGLTVHRQVPPGVSSTGMESTGLGATGTGPGTEASPSDAAGVARAIRGQTAAIVANAAAGTEGPGVDLDAGETATPGMDTTSPVPALHAAGTLQAKLEVSSPDDPAELEAERVARTVTRMNDPLGLEGEGAISHDIERAPTTAQSGPTVTGEHERQLESSMGRGKPLPTATRTFFEPRFGQDLSSVRIHTGPKADAAARSINAEAFTHGRDIAFRNGMYNPQSSAGKHLLAHELTHVIQQSQASSSGANRLHRNVDSDDLDYEGSSLTAHPELFTEEENGEAIMEQVQLLQETLAEYIEYVSANYEMPPEEALASGNVWIRHEDSTSQNNYAVDPTVESSHSTSGLGVNAYRATGQRDSMQGIQNMAFLMGLSVTAMTGIGAWGAAAGGASAATMFIHGLRTGGRVAVHTIQFSGWVVNRVKIALGMDMEGLGPHQKEFFWHNLVGNDDVVEYWWNHQGPGESENATVAFDRSVFEEAVDQVADQQLNEESTVHEQAQEEAQEYLEGISDYIGVIESNRSRRNFPISIEPYELDLSRRATIRGRDTAAVELWRDIKRVETAETMPDLELYQEAKSEFSLLSIPHEAALQFVEFLLERNRETLLENAQEELEQEGGDVFGHASEAYEQLSEQESAIMSIDAEEGEGEEDEFVEHVREMATRVALWEIENNRPMRSISPNHQWDRIRTRSRMNNETRTVNEWDGNRFKMDPNPMLDSLEIDFVDNLVDEYRF